MATVPAWWQQGATRINPLEQTWSGSGDSPSHTERFTMNNYDQILKDLGVPLEWIGGAPDDPSQGAFRAQDVQDYLNQNGYQMMANQGVGAGGGSDTYQNLNWIQDAQGNMVGDPSFNRDDPNGVLKMVALAAGGYFGGGALANAAGGAGAGAGAAAGAGEGLGTMGTIGAGSGQYAAIPGVLESGVSLGSVPAVSGTVAGAGGLGGITAGQALGGASAAAGLGGSGGGGSVDPYGAGSGWGQDTLSNMGATNDTGASWLDSLRGLVGTNGMIPWQNVLGAYAGYKSSQDQQQTSSRDPWSGAQPMLKGLLDQGQQLQQQYAAQPFSQQQQTAYNNLGGLLNAANTSAPGLLAGMAANSSGANNYDRANPRKALQGGGASLSGFNPGLLQFFGGK